MLVRHRLYYKALPKGGKQKEEMRDKSPSQIPPTRTAFAHYATVFTMEEKRKGRRRGEETGGEEIRQEVRTVDCGREERLQ